MRSGQHTGLTDIPLTERGERNARRLGERSAWPDVRPRFHQPVDSCPSHLRIGRLRGPQRRLIRILLEWNYGDYEGRTTADIHRDRPDWQLFRDGCPGGESVAAISDRADRVIARVRAIEGDVSALLQRPFPARAGRPLAGLDASGRRFVLSRAPPRSACWVTSTRLDEPVIRSLERCSPCGPLKRRIEPMAISSPGRQAGPGRTC